MHELGIHTDADEGRESFWAEGSYAEGILIFDLPDATGSQAPKFIYEKQK